MEMTTLGLTKRRLSGEETYEERQAFQKEMQRADAIKKVLESQELSAQIVAVLLKAGTNRDVAMGALGAASQLFSNCYPWS